MEISGVAIAWIVLIGASVLIVGGALYIAWRGESRLTREACLRNGVAQWALSAADYASFLLASGEVARLQSRRATVKILVTLIVVATIVFALGMATSPGRTGVIFLSFVLAGGLFLAILAGEYWYEQRVANRREGCSYDVVIGVHFMVETFVRNGEVCDRKVTPFRGSTDVSRLPGPEVPNLLSWAEVAGNRGIPEFVVTVYGDKGGTSEIRVPIPRGGEAEAKRAAEALVAMHARARVA